MGLGSREMDVLTKLVDNSKDFVPVFSTSGVFIINKTLICSVIGNVATYFIITIQLNENEYQKILKN